MARRGGTREGFAPSPGQKLHDAAARGDEERVQERLAGGASKADLEWKDENGKPVTLYWNPITLLEKNRLLKKSDNLNDIAILADVLVMKSLLVIFLLFFTLFFII